MVQQNILNNKTASRRVNLSHLDSIQARLAPLLELQSQTQEELDALLPSVLRSAGVPFRPY